MSARAYYNENDPFAAAWLRQLIAQDLIAPGDVDERSVEDVLPSDLANYTQCHFFAGIGGWSYALRLAGWSDDRPVWTGSCPCQPFSAAGKGAGTTDERHLWPAWFHLIAQCRPDIIFGEQVDAAINHGWLDLVQSDVEGEGYAFGAVGLPSAGVGAFDIRQRLWWVADAAGERRVGEHALLRPEAAGRDEADFLEVTGSGAVGELADDDSSRRRTGWAGEAGNGTDATWIESAGFRDAGNVADSVRERIADSGSRSTSTAQGGVQAADGQWERLWPHPWQRCDFIHCRDGKLRPVEPGTFPLAHGIPARVGRLRGYGNAINPYVAKVFVESYLAAVGAPSVGATRGGSVRVCTPVTDEAAAVVV